jgi:hypothetical protein
MMKKNSLLGVAIFLIVFIFFSMLPAPCQGAMPPAVYNGRLFPDGNPPSTIFVTGFGSYSAVWNSNNRFSNCNLFLSPGDPARVTASVRAFLHGGVIPVSWGNIKYFTRVSKKNPQVPDGTQVPLLIRAKGIASMFFAPGTPSPDGVEAIVSFNNETLMVAAIYGPAPIITEISRDVTVTRSVPVETDIPILIQAGGGWTAVPFNTNGGIFAFVDPVIKIDPNFMVTVNGALVPATQVLKLEFSPGFNQGSAEAALQLLLLD